MPGEVITALLNQRFHLKITLEELIYAHSELLLKTKLFLNNENIKFSVNPRKIIGNILKELYDSLKKKKKDCIQV